MLRAGREVRGIYTYDSSKSLARRNNDKEMEGIIGLPSTQKRKEYYAKITEA